MSPSVVRSEDAKQLFRLAGECREQTDGGARRRHFLSRVAEITRSKVAIEGTFAFSGLDVPPRIRHVSDIGWANDGERDRLYDRVATTPIGSDPLSGVVLSGLSDRRIVTAQRRDAMSMRDWERTEIRNELHRPARVDDSLVSVMRGDDPGDVHLLVFKRAWGDPPFTSEDCQIVDLAHAELSWIFVLRDTWRAPLRGQLPGSAGAWSTLERDFSRRERQTLELLLTGASEKGIAEALGLSRYTVHDYVKVVYRKMGVGSRAELMASALAAQPPTRD
jgi:DNA-binding CsgD family transcriptional regulator